jgi:hypothetical protein
MIEIDVRSSSGKRTEGRAMTAQEKDRIQNAIRHIKTSVDIDSWAMEIAVEAMEKQVPKKPVMGYAFTEKMREVIKRTNPKRAESKTECCPVCGKKVEYPYEHCKRCGQKICWGKSDEQSGSD